MKIKNYLKSILTIVFITTSIQVHAHVKWFTEFELNSPPRPIFSVLLNTQFIALVFITSILIFTVAYLDRHLLRQKDKANIVIQTISARSEKYLPLLLRMGVCGFLLAVANEGGTLLTPELKTSINWISWYQVGLALLALHHRTAVFTGLGILSLYALTIKEHGLFHALDYPIFLGIATYLIIVSIKGQSKQAMALNILRIATGITLLWASIEKWAFPEWSFNLIKDKPEMVMGLSSELFLLLAGFVEFCAAFLLITGNLSSRASAILLLFIFTSAIWSFGYIDAVGHSGIIVVLVMLIFSNNTLANKFDVKGNLMATATLNSCWYITAIFLFYFCYYAGYYSEYSASIL